MDDVDAVEDAELVRRCAAGDREAGNALLGRYQRQLYLVCRRITGNDEDALDALQDALVAVWRHIGTFRGDARFSSWAYRIGSNAALAVVSRRQREPVMAPTAEAADRRSGPEARVVATDTVDWALSRLPPQFRAAVVLRDLLELSYGEVATALDVPLNTAKTRISRGRQALLDLLVVRPDQPSPQ